MEKLTRDYRKFDISINKKPRIFVRIWKDPVWSKVLSAAIIGLLAIIYSAISNLFIGDSFTDFIINVLTFKIKLYWFLLLIVFSVIIIVVINYYIKRRRLMPTDFIINMKIGDFKYIELINALNSHLLITPESLRKASTDKMTLLDCFILYARKITEGVSINDEGDQENFLIFTVCPILEAYGLVIRKKEKNPRPNTGWDINFYYISDKGRKFYQALQVYRVYLDEKMEEW